MFGAGFRMTDRVFSSPSCTHSNWHLKEYPIIEARSLSAQGLFRHHTAWRFASLSHSSVPPRRVSLFMPEVSCRVLLRSDSPKSSNSIELLAGVSSAVAVSAVWKVIVYPVFCCTVKHGSSHRAKHCR